jgi:putative zinc finger protein
MRCKRLDHLLPAYLDGDLPGTLNQRVSDHLDSCERCRQELLAQQRALRSLEAVRRPISIDLWADFSRRLQAEAPPRPSPWRLLWQPSLAMALAAAAVVLVTAIAPKPGLVPAANSSLRTIRVAIAPGRGLEAARDPRSVWSGRINPLPGSQAVLVGRKPPQSSRAAAAADGSSTIYRTRPAPAEHPRRRLSSNRTRRPGPHTSVGRHWRVLALRPVSPPILRLAGFPGSERKINAEVPLTQGAVATRHGSAVTPEHASSRMIGVRDRTGDPFKIAEALVLVEQNAANDQMKGELLRLAREVARVGGEAVAEDAAEHSAGRVSTGNDSPHASADPTGT